MKLQIDFSKPVRPIGKLNGTNNGPLHCFSDRTAEYKEMGVDFVRFHETHSYNTKCVEVPFIFRNFDADENDEKNYYFGETDAVIRAAVDAGIEICYRLGMGTEGSKPRLFMICPKDSLKWAKIAAHIIRHYNEGWANGFHYNIRYWEIWNEADIPEYWPDPDRMTYIPFYKTASNYLKKEFPHLLFSPSGFAGIHARTEPDVEALIKAGETRERAEYLHQNWASRIVFFRELFRGTAAGEYPMDFFSWHTYSANSQALEDKCWAIKERMDEFGLFEKIPLVNTEWAPVSLRRDPHGNWDFTQFHDIQNAVQLIADMIVMQQYGNIAAAYYDTDERSKFSISLYDFEGNRGNFFHALKSWRILRAAGEQVETAGDGFPVRLCAAAGNGRKVAVLTNEGEDTAVTLAIAGIEAGTPVKITLFAEGSMLEKSRSVTFNGKALSLRLKKNTALFLHFESKLSK